MLRQHSSARFNSSLSPKQESSEQQVGKSHARVEPHTVGLQRGVFSVTSSREGVTLRLGHPRDLDHQPAASCDQHPSWCGPQHSSSAARPRRQRAKTPSTWPSPALYWEGADRPHHSELSPAFHRPKETEKTIYPYIHACGRHNRTGASA